MGKSSQNRDSGSKKTYTTPKLEAVLLRADEVLYKGCKLAGTCDVANPNPPFDPPASDPGS